MDPGFVDLNVLGSSKTFFATEDGGMLRIAPSSDGESGEQYIKIHFILGLEFQDENVSGWDEDYDTCYCLIRVTDSEGSAWEAKSLFNTDVLLENIEDWRRAISVRRFDEAGEEWRLAFETRTLLNGIRGYYDDRLVRRIIFNDQITEILFKYERPIFDIAFLEDRTDGGEEILDFSRLLVRVSQFRDYAGHEVPPFVYEMSCETLLFYPNTQGLPEPLVFKKLDSTGQPQSCVRYVSGKSTDQQHP